MDNKDFEISSGNIFADLGASNPEERLAKAQLAMQINLLIKKKRLSQKSAAELLGIDQPKISALAQGKLAGFSLERLFRLLNILGQEITIKIAPKTQKKKRSNITVNFKKIKPKSMSEEQMTRPVVIAKKK